MGYNLPKRFNKEVHNLPSEAFHPSGYTLGTNNAAKFLGVSSEWLVYYTDKLGLTVCFRSSNGWKYYLKKELEELKAEWQKGMSYKEAKNAAKRGRL